MLFATFKKALGPALLALAGSALQAQTDLLVAPKKGTSLEKLAKKVASVGKILKKDRAGTYRVELKKGVDPVKAMAKLEATAGHTTMTPRSFKPGPFEPSSFSSMEEHVEAILEKHPEVEEGEEIEGLGLDYLEAYLWWFKDRAWPNDKIDDESYRQAAVHRDKMQAANISRGGALITGNWQFVGPTNLNVPYQQYWGTAPVNGRVNALAFNSNGTAIYLAAPEGGIWKSVNGGVNWTPLSDKWPFMQTNAVACHPTNPNIVYAGTGDFDGMRSPYGMGVMKSVDGGATWTNSGFQEFSGYAISQILIDPDNPEIVTVFSGRGTGQENYIYRSINGGTSWTNVTPNITANWSDADYGIKDPQTGLRAYYATGGQWGGLMLRSTDQGATWWYVLLPTTTEVKYQQIEVACSKTSPNWVYIIVPDNKKVYYSNDYGENFYDLTSGFPNGDSNDANYNWSQGFYDVHLTSIVNGQFDRLIAGLINIQQTVDGTTWTDLGGPVWDQNNARTHSDQHAFAINPTNGNDAVFGNDGGVYRWNISANTLTNLNRNLGITQFYHAAFHPTNPNIILGGVQDNASPYSNGNLASWANVGQGDGGWANINRLNPLIQYTSSQFMNCAMTTDGWANKTSIPPPVQAGDVRPFIGVFELCNNNPRYLYAGTDYLYRYDQTTNTWTPHVGQYKFTTDQGAHVRAISTAPTDLNRLYVGTTDGQLHTSGTFGSAGSWKRIDNTAATPLPIKSISSVNVHPTNPKSVLVGVLGSGGNNGHLWQCTDTTVAAPVWTNVSGTGGSGLPDIAINTIERDPADPANTWYIGADNGVYMTTNGGSTWANATAPLGMPNCQVNKLKAVPGTGYLMAATFARGIWRISLGAAVPRKLASITIPSSVTGGANFQGTVTIDGAAPPGGSAVALSDNTTAINTPGAASVAAGATTGTFNCTTQPVSTAATRTVTGSMGGVTKSDSITLLPAQALKTFTASPSAVVGGTSTTGTVTMATAVAGTAPLNVALATNTSSIQVPANASVPPGGTTATFTINSSRVNAVYVRQVTGTYNGVKKTINITLNPTPGLANFTLSRTSVQGGTPTVGTITLANVAPTGGAKVLVSTNTSVIVVPPSVMVNAGSKTAAFTANTLYVGTAATRTITVNLAGTARTVNLGLLPGPALANFTANPTTLKGGNNSTGTLTLNKVAPTGGTVVMMTYNSSVITGPASVTVPAGVSSTTFTIGTKAVGATSTRSLSATLGAKKTVNLTLTP